MWRVPTALCRLADRVFPASPGRGVQWAHTTSLGTTNDRDTGPVERGMARKGRKGSRRAVHVIVDPVTTRYSAATERLESGKCERLRNVWPCI